MSASAMGMEALQRLLLAAPPPALRAAWLWAPAAAAWLPALPAARGCVRVLKFGRGWGGAHGSSIVPG
eukprot:COSAG01_NODE_24939_length_761_cov_0.950151_1_plen_68_part_00